MKTKLDPIRIIIKRYDIKPKKNLGQNFLHDLNISSRIATTAGILSHSNIIEIGPGPGALTRALLENGAHKVFAIEKDSKFNKALKEIQEYYPNRLSIINDDILYHDIQTICNPPRKVIANLPYNIATPILINCLRSINAFESITLMLQKEFAERLCALPRTKSYGRLSIITQWLCKVKIEFNVPKECFVPSPKVNSAVVSLVPRSSPISKIKFGSLERVTAAAFGQRRKMLRSSLAKLPINIDECQISPNQRAEEISVDDFCKLALALEKKI